MVKQVRWWYEKKTIIGLLINQNMFDIIAQKSMKNALNTPRIKQMLDTENSTPFAQKAQLFASYGLIAVMCDWQKRGFQESEDEMITLINNLLLKPLYSPDKLKKK